MFKMKRFIAFLLTVVMVFSCMPVSLATETDNQVTDTVRNPDIVLIPKEEQKEEEVIIPELLTLTSEELSVNPLSEERLEFLKGLIPGGETKSPKILWFTRIMNAIAPPKTGTYVGYAAFDIAMVNPEEAQQYIVNVQLNNPIELLQEENVVIDSLTCELFHIHADENGDDVLAETITESTGLDVTCEDGRITAFSFPTSDFSDFILKYTVEFHTKEGGVFTCNIIGAQDILLSAILDGIQIAEDGDTAAFMANIASVSVSNPDVISLNQTENDWTFRVLKEFDTQESLQILMQDETEHTITVAATGITEIATENETAVISTVDNYYLPEEASAFAEIREGTEEDAAVAAVQEVTGTEEQIPQAAEKTLQTMEQGTVTEEQSAYQVLNIGLENVETGEYEGFDVSVSLGEELVGKDFRLYEVQDGQATDITDTLQLSAETQVDGSQNVQGFSFTTNDFAEYVLTYSLVTYYTTFDGQTFKITLNYGPEAGIPEEAELMVREILPEEEAFNRYLNESAEKLGISSSEVAFARFFDIEIWKENEKVEPAAPVQVTIAYIDEMPLGEDASLNVIHFANEGTEVITDIAVTDDNKEITYEQGSFSVTGTIISGGSSPRRDAAYAVVIQNPATNKYYVVQNDGSLAEAKYNPGSNTIEMDYPIMWTYTSAHDGIADNGLDREYDQYLGNEPYNLRITADARKYDDNQLAIGYFYRYISPNNPSGVETESSDSDHGSFKWNNGLRYDNNNHRLYGITWNNSANRFDITKYIGADFDNLHITGNNEQNAAASVYLAQITVVPGQSADNETVSHIDIAIKGNGVLDVPLAYGDYYNAEGQVILTVSADNNITLHLKQNVDIDKYDIMGASLHAYDEDGNELNDAFYITGYSANQQNEHSPVQVRMAGSFKVDTLGKYPSQGWWDRSNENERWRQRRLQNQVYYRISAEKEVKFYFIDEDQNIPQLYDRYGNKLTVNAIVNMSAGFSYWNKDNECPPLLEDFEEKYPWINQGHAPGTNKEAWENGAIIDNSNGYPGDSGMDFVLGNVSDSTGKVFAVEIVKIIEDPAGARIHPNSGIKNDFKLFRNPNGSPASVANLAIYPNSVQSSDINYSGYSWFRDHSIVVGQDGIGVLYDYDVRKGMYYISEESGPFTNNGANAVITDIDGTKWKYKETRVETEYVWRQEGDTNKRHAANGYSGVPEILGEYENGLKNEFLEFYVHNIYEPVSGSLEITKAINPSTFDSGNDVFTFEVTLKKNGNPYHGNVVVTDRIRATETSAATDSNGKLTVSVSGAGTAIISDIPCDITYIVEEINLPNGWEFDNILYDNENKVITTDKTDTVTVTNKPTVEKTITKVWDDANNQDGIRPASVEVVLTGTAGSYSQEYKVTLNGEADTEVPTAAGGYESAAWTAKFVNLPKYNNGTEITYTYSETTTAVITGKDGASTYAINWNGNIVTNKHTPGKTQITVTKKWDDADNQNGTRPDNIKVQLYANGNASGDPVTLPIENEDGSKEWTYTWDNLNKNANGTPIIYTVKEDGEVNGRIKFGDTEYIVVVNGDAENGYTITNYRPQKKETEVSSNGTTYTNGYTGTGTLGMVKVGDIIKYELSYKNYKTTTAVIKIKDKLDPNVAFDSASEGGSYDSTTHTVNWTLENIGAGNEGTVWLKVKVLPSALKPGQAMGNVVNNGDTASVQVDNDREITLNTIENPVPQKKETKPYEGTGLLGNVHVGDEITYEISYKNYKTEAATVTIKDKLDKNVEFVSASNSGALADGVVTWTLADVMAGESGVVTLTVKVLPGALVSNGGTGSVINGGDTTTVQVGNDREITLNTVENPVPEKKETKPYEGTGLLGAVKVGDEITYEISYRNYKTAAATVTIKDKLDKNVAFVSASNGGTNNSGTVVWTLADVPAGQAGVVTLTVKVLPGALVSNGGAGSVINDGDTATVQVGNDAEFTLNTVENPVPEEPEKKETKPYEGTGLLGNVHVGDEITYEISYKNYKTEAADVVIRDRLDRNVEFVSASDGGKLADGVVTWTLSAVPAGEAGKVTLTVKVLPGALVSNGGNGSVINGGDTASVKVGNDNEFTLNTVENPVPEKKETKPYKGTGLLGFVKVGDEITYEISYRNYKTEAATVTIKDKLDKNVAFVSASDGGTNNGGTVVWTLADVPAGKAGTVSLTVKVLPGALVSNGGTGSVINDGDTATVKVGNDAEFKLNTVENPVPEKREIKPYKGTGLLGSVKVGDEITYEISYRNYKTAAATVTIKDKLDKNVAFVSASNGGTNNGGTVIWTLANVPAGQAGTVTLTVKVLEGALKSRGGPDKVVNGGDTATVKVGNDKEYTLNTVENPVSDTVSVSFRKTWDDDDNKAGLRPVNLRVTLSDGHSYILNEGNNWSVTVENLPAEKDGVPITYTWSEQSVFGYTLVENRKDGNTTIFVNRYSPVVVPPTPKNPAKRKVPGEPVVYFDDYETPLGVQVIINHVGDCYE